VSGAQQIWMVAASVYAGLLTATCIVAAISYDLVALRYGWRTVSEETYLVSRKHPWVAVLAAGMLCFAAGVLVGHLFFPQTGPPAAEKSEADVPHR
jgi:hypothetical protein